MENSQQSEEDIKNMELMIKSLKITISYLKYFPTFLFFNHSHLGLHLKFPPKFRRLKNTQSRPNLY
jgi:hypothetical protein